MRCNATGLRFWSFCISKISWLHSRRSQWSKISQSLHSWLAVLRMYIKYAKHSVFFNHHIINYIKKYICNCNIKIYIRALFNSGQICVVGNTKQNVSHLWSVCILNMAQFFCTVLWKIVIYTSGEYTSHYKLIVRWINWPNWLARSVPLKPVLGPPTTAYFNVSHI